MINACLVTDCLRGGGGEMGCLDKEFVLRYDGYVERAFAFASYTAKCMFASLDYFARKCGMVSV